MTSLKSKIGQLERRGFDLVELESKGQQKFQEHLKALRRLCLQLIFILFVATLICYYFSDFWIQLARRPVQNFLSSTQGALIFTSPTEQFFAHLKVSFLAAVLLSSPLWSWSLWFFVAPGLYRQERRWALFFVGFASILFVGGACFAYMVVYPLALDFLLNFSNTGDRAMLTIKNYLSFFFQITVTFGFMFELPLVLFLLSFFGWISPSFLREKRPYAIVGLAFVSALLSPPDVMSMLLLFFPLILLYELTLLFLYFIPKA